MFCRHCGHQLEAESKFCSNCGSGLDSDLSANSHLKTRPKLNKKTLVVSGAVVLTLVASAVAAVLVLQNIERNEYLKVQNSVATVFDRVVKKCQKLGFGFEHDYSYLAVDGMGQEDFLGATYTEVQCVVDGLQMPPADKARWMSTRALDGVQEATWSAKDGTYSISASWTYHPDNGSDINFAIKSDFLKDYVPKPKSSSQTS